MAKITYTYKSYSNSPRATQYSKGREATTALLSGVTGIFSVGAVIAFFICTYTLFSEGNWSSFLIAFLIIFLAALFDAYIFVLRSNNTECNLNIILFEELLIKKKNHHISKIDKFDELAKIKIQYVEELKEYEKRTKKENRDNNIKFLRKYFIYFFLGVFIAISVIGIVQGIIDCNYATLLVSLVAFLILGCLFFFALPIGKKIFTKKLVKKENSYNEKTMALSKEKLFCRKCGAQILPDSVYCDKCGSKVEHL